MNYVKGFYDLEVYKASRVLAKEIYILTQGFPSHERYSLIDQIRRSSRSVGAQIAESWGKRKYEKHFVSKLSDAVSEQLETQHWIEVAFECNYINDIERNKLLNYCQSIGKMLNSMVEKSTQFCNHP